MKTLLLLAAAAVVAGLTACDDGAALGRPAYTVNKCLQTEKFQWCMQHLPAGPNNTKYNDWDEVISECNSVAREQSYRLRADTPRECRAD